jgi:hypothetical protein
MEKETQSKLRFHCGGVPGSSDSEIPFHSIDSVSYVASGQF